MELSRQEYWSGLPVSFSPGDLPDPGIEPRSPALQADSYHKPFLQCKTKTVSSGETSSSHSVSLPHVFKIILSVLICFLD